MYQFVPFLPLLVLGVFILAHMASGYTVMESVAALLDTESGNLALVLAALPHTKNIISTFWAISFYRMFRDFMQFFARLTRFF